MTGLVPGSANGSVVLRAPNHLGDVVMALPAIRATGGADVLALRWLLPLLDMAREAEPEQAGIRDLLPLERGSRGMLAAARRLRGRRYDVGIVLPPSISSALLFAMAGVRRRRGFPTDARRFLLTDALPPLPDGSHRATRFMTLVTGAVAERPTPILPIPPRQHDRWRAIAGAVDRPLVGISPGSNTPSRRWDPERYAEVVRRLRRRGVGVAVFGGPGEEDLVRFVSGGLALEVAGAPDLPLLAAGIASCDLALTNDSGPMHVAAAVGTRTVALIGPTDPRLTGPLGMGHVLVLAADRDSAPSGPHDAPRAGHGPRLPKVENESMRPISVDQVEDAVLGQLLRQPQRGG